ncbi:MAG: C45 family peptidase [Bacteroidota bacterium]
MYHPRLYGSFYDMGFKYGSMLYQKANFQLPEISEAKREFGLASYAELQQFYPEVIDEIEGFAKGIHDQPERLGAFLLSLGVFNTTGQCSVFAFKNSTSVVVGRNYDMLFRFKKFTESSLIAASDKFSYIGQSDVFIGRSDGINEKGLFIAMSFVDGTEIQPGVSFHFIIRRVLEECSTTKEALKLIETAKISSAGNFLVADTSGEIAVIEAATQKKEIRRPLNNKPFVSITNQFVTEEMKPFDAGNVGWSKSSERLHALNNRLMHVDELTISDAKEIVSDTCICLDLKKEQFGTIWSVVADLNTLHIERAETKPKPTNFKPENRLNWWLKKKAG